MKELILSNDSYQMNWVEGNIEWGTVICKANLTVDKKSYREGDIIKEEYTFTNHTNREVFTELTDIKIYVPFNDDYTTAQECMERKCHTHIWCGDDIAYIMALRMGGEAPHLGLVLNKGAIHSYSIERDIERISNDRGDFILHPKPFSLSPKESYVIAWTLFPHNGKEDFYKKIVKYCNRFLDVQAENYVLFSGEDVIVKIKANYNFTKEEVEITQNGKKVDFIIKEQTIFIKEASEATGEIKYQISVKGVNTFLRLLVLPNLKELVKARCHFITQRQQYNKLNSRLNGAYLIYDNQDNSLFYSSANDYNGGRERVGMGILLAKYLQTQDDPDVDKSLRHYIEYVKRELVNESTGEVYNDYMCNNKRKRLYNSPWFALFYLELYQLYKRSEYLIVAYKIIVYYYENGGTRFYPIELPIIYIISCMSKENMDKEIQVVMEYFKQHADFIAKTGIDYPRSEVNYEQSIVAPAADILFQVYMLTKNQEYLEAAKKQLKVLELFNGRQPDYHLYEVAIRHWDGYWFGKNKMYGDTFPHYWSSLTGIVYRYYSEVTGNKEYQEKFKKSLRATLSLFYPDGTASCAYVYPATVNGQKANFADPYANDQDWGLYYAWKYLES